MKISILMPVKNASAFLTDCIDSIINQSYSNWELIAIDDHSDDDSSTVIEQYALKDQRFQCVVNDGSGIISALQTAYAHSTGDLITRMDADDLMTTDKLSVLHNNLVAHGPGYIAVGGVKYFSDDILGDGYKRYESWLNQLTATGENFTELYRECVIPSPCWMMYREDFERIGAFDSEIYPEDYDLCFRFYQAGLRVVGIDKVLHFWRDRSERISRTWQVYKDNRYFDMKLRYFLKIDREVPRPLVLWGAGRNGKDMAKLLQKNEQTFHWVCDNQNKIGKDVYGVRMEHFDVIKTLDNPQIITVVASPEGREQIAIALAKWGKHPVQDYWFFL